jgi:hypothetical protein
MGMSFAAKLGNAMDIRSKKLRSSYYWLLILKITHLLASNLHYFKISYTIVLHATSISLSLYPVYMKAKLQNRWFLYFICCPCFSHPFFAIQIICFIYSLMLVGGSKITQDMLQMLVHGGWQAKDDEAWVLSCRCIFVVVEETKTCELRKRLATWGVGWVGSAVFCN